VFFVNESRRRCSEVWLEIWKEWEKIDIEARYVICDREDKILIDPVESGIHRECGENCIMKRFIIHSLRQVQ
jgi:hypothetical protein